MTRDAICGTFSTIAEKGAGEIPAPFLTAAIGFIGKTEYRNMHYRTLGRLERVDLETLWNDEPSGFAPWFVDPDRLRMLGSALGLRLEPAVGTLTAGADRVGLVCRDAGTGSTVAIKSQLGESGHAPFGALLVRATECRAPIAVWLAERFTEEHRAVLERLSRTGKRKIGFLGVEMGLWRIGDSPVAPRFDVVAEPEGWPRPDPLPEKGLRRHRHLRLPRAERSPVRTASAAR